VQIFLANVKRTVMWSKRVGKRFERWHAVGIFAWVAINNSSTERLSPLGKVIFFTYRCVVVLFGPVVAHIIAVILKKTVVVYIDFLYSL